MNLPALLLAVLLTPTPIEIEDKPPVDPTPRDTAVPLFAILQLTDDDTFDTYPTLNSLGQVVWIGGGEQSNELFYFDGIEVHQMTDDEYRIGSTNSINDAGQIAWYNEVGNDEIFLYSNGTVQQLTHDSGANAYIDDRHPQLNERGQLSWMRSNTIMFHDGVSAAPLASPVYGSPFPRLNELGQIAWEQDHGDSAEIYFYDGQEVRRITDDVKRDRTPVINNLGQLAWTGGSGRHGEIYFWDGQTTTRLTDDTVQDSIAGLNDDGQIVWYRYGPRSEEIYLWDGRIKRITDNDARDYHPNLNRRGEIAWIRGSGTETEVFHYDGERVVQVTDNGGNKWGTVMGDGGHIVWWQRPGNDLQESEVFLAIPMTTLFEDLVRYYRSEILAGGLVGTPVPFYGQRVFRKRLLQLVSYVEADRHADACRSVAGLLPFVDGRPAPDDLLTGDSVETLHGLLARAQGALECESGSTRRERGRR